MDLPVNAIAISRHIAASPDRVWAVVTDIEHSAEVIRAIDGVEMHSGADFRVGTRWTETRTMMGRTATETMEVTAVEPVASYVVEAESAGTHYRSEFRLTPEGDGTFLTMTFSAHPTTLGAKVLAATLGRLFSSATRKALAADLDDIAQAAESGG